MEIIQILEVNKLEKEVAALTEMASQKGVVQRMLFIEEVQEEITKIPQPNALDKFDVD